MTKADIHRLSDQQRMQMEQVLNDMAQLNRSIMEAVNAGLTVELQRMSRHHCGGGNWGDIMGPQFLSRSN
jgi:hypothetical protein